MKGIRSALLFLMLCCTSAAFAQRALVVTGLKAHDFGVLHSDDGLTSCTFTFQNKSDKPVLITTVAGSCSCIIAEWTQKPILPGKTGQVKITYNPKGHKGFFLKKIKVFSNGNEKPLIVQVRGKVMKR